MKPETLKRATVVLVAATVPLAVLVAVRITLALWSQ